MKHENPYQSPTGMEGASAGNRPSLDLGLIAGRYFQGLAVFSVINVVILAIFFDRWFFDWTPLLTLWTAKLLINHSKTARSWVIGVCSFFAIVSSCTLAVVVIGGGEGISFSFGPITLEDPSFATAMMLLFFYIGVVAIPVFLLANSTARRQFDAHNDITL